MSRWITVPASAAAIFVIFTPMHDSTHGAVFSVFDDKSGRSILPRSVRVFLNSLVGRIAGWYFLAPFPAFRYVHLQHHKQYVWSDVVALCDVFVLIRCDLMHLVYVQYKRSGARSGFLVRYETSDSDATSLVLSGAALLHTVLPSDSVSPAIRSGRSGCDAHRTVRFHFSLFVDLRIGTALVLAHSIAISGRISRVFV